MIPGAKNEFDLSKVGKDFTLGEFKMEAQRWAAFPKEKYQEWVVSVCCPTPGYMNPGFRPAPDIEDYHNGAAQWMCETIANSVNAATELKALAIETAAFLAEMEWHPGGYCPYCGRSEQIGEHKEDCKLAALANKIEELLK